MPLANPPEIECIAPSQLTGQEDALKLLFTVKPMRAKGCKHARA